MKNISAFIGVVLAGLALNGWTMAAPPPADTDGYTDLQSWINSRLAAGETDIKIPKGTYRMKPDVFHLGFANLKNITLDFQGSELIGTQNTRAFDFEQCENVTVKNFSLDYDPKLYSQGRIIKIENGSYEIEVFEGYPVEEAGNHKAEIFDQNTHELIRGGRTFYRLKEVAPIGGRRLRVTPKEQEAVDRLIKVGDIMVLDIEKARKDGKRYVPHAIYMMDCARMSFENVTIYASPTFCFLEEQCTEGRYYRCKVTRRTDDPSVGYPRMRSSNFDAFHSVSAVVGPHIEECTAGYMGDDNTNIRGDYHIVVEGAGPDLFVISRGNMNIQPGDPVEMVNLSGGLLGRAKVLAIEKVKNYPAEKIAKVKRDDLPQMIIWNRCTDVYKITLDQSVPVTKTFVICAMNRVGSGYKIINCKLGHNRGRGVLAKAGNGLIQGNLVEGCAMEAIDLSTAIPNWLEASVHENVTVVSNVVRDCKFVWRTGHRENSAVIIKSCRSNLVFKDNVIEYSRNDGAVWIQDLDGGVIQNNTFVRKEGGEGEPLTLKNCRNITKD